MTDRKFARPGVGAQLARQLDPGRVGEHPVEQHEVGQALVDLPARLGGVAGEHWLVARVAQVDRDQFADGGFVFDDKYFCVHGRKIMTGE